MRTRLLAALALLALPAPAVADVAPPPLDEVECPVGAVAVMDQPAEGETDPLGRPARPWPICVPTTCASDADCEDGRVCSRAEIGMCLEAVEGRAHPNIRRRGCEPDGTCSTSTAAATGRADAWRPTRGPSPPPRATAKGRRPLPPPRGRRVADAGSRAGRRRSPGSSSSARCSSGAASEPERAQVDAAALRERERHEPRT